MTTFLTENEIRPANFAEGMETAKQIDLERLRARKPDFVAVACPACESRQERFVFDRYGFRFAECEKCRTVFMSPRATPEILGQFYSDSVLYDYWNRHVFPATEEARREKIFRPRARRILDVCKRLKVGNDCLVEIGAGFGTFCEEMRGLGAFKRVVAVEPGKALAAQCRKRGLEVIEAQIEKLELEAKPNVIACFEVIEHVFSPNAFLRTCRQLLQPGGLIIATCPNFQGFDITTLGKDSDSIDAEHINLFNPSSVELLFRRSGFRMLECFTPGELDAEIVRKRVLAGHFDLSSQPFLKTVLLERWEELGGKFQKFLQDNRLSSNMWMVGQAS